MYHRKVMMQPLSRSDLRNLTRSKLMWMVKRPRSDVKENTMPTHKQQKSHAPPRISTNPTGLASEQPRGSTNPGVDWYFSKHEKWATALRKLRAIALECQLTEELKWGCPCYTLSGSNIVLIHVFKAYCALLFFKGALLKQGDGLLVQQTKNVQVARQLRFTELNEVVNRESLVRACILEAIAVEKSGVQVQLKQSAAFDVPEEFERKLNELPALKNAFEALTPGRQRGYLLHFSSAKLSKTREARVAQGIERILLGKGLDD
jgi:uncharacterized protein YdeI (YjbR/CyaY-like superfamily)